MGDSVDLFFETLEKKTDGGKKLPNWHGELYLEVCTDELPSPDFVTSTSVVP